MQLLFRTKPKIFKTNPVLFRTMPILFRIFCDIFVLVTFQIWWHFSFGDILVLAIFQYPDHLHCQKVFISLRTSRAHEALKERKSATHLLQNTTCSRSTVRFGFFLSAKHQISSSPAIIWRGYIFAWLFGWLLTKKRIVVLLNKNHSV